MTHNEFTSNAEDSSEQTQSRANQSRVSRATEPPRNHAGHHEQPRSREGHSAERFAGGSADSLLDILRADKGLAVRLTLAAVAVGAFYYIKVWILAAPFSEGINPVGAIFGIGFSFVLIGVSYHRSVRNNTTGEDISAYPAEADPALHARVGELATRMGITRPTIMKKESEGPEAYTVGRAGNGYIVLSNHILEEYASDEVEAIIAHEMAHLKHRGSIITALAVTATKVIQYSIYLLLASFAFFVNLMRYDRYRFRDRLSLAFRSVRRGYTGLIVAGTVRVVGGFMLLFTRAFSRYREFLADRRAAAHLDSPRGMVRALKRIESDFEEQSGDAEKGGVPASLCIHGSVESLLGTLFDTHPPMETRIARLEDRYGMRESHQPIRNNEGDDYRHR